MTLYDVLGVAPGATSSEIHAAYLALARRHHPDAHSGDGARAREAAEARMREVNDAWAVLGDEHRRRVYDVGIGVRTVIDERDVFRPFDPGPDDGAGDLEDDAEPLGPTSPLQRRAAVVPAILLVAAVVAVAAGMILRYGRLALFGGILAVAAGVLFLVLPLLALAEASRHDR